MKTLNVIGKTFGWLTILSEVGKDKWGQRLFLTRCHCGTEKIIRYKNMAASVVISCGCYNREVSRIINSKHEKSQLHKSEYKSWSSARHRCTNPKSPKYKDYGGRGIKMCSRWDNSFDNFFSDMGPRPLGFELERIDNDGDYEPSNCKWATHSEEQLNKRTSRKIQYMGETKNIEVWSRLFHINSKTLWARIEMGWDIETALTRIPNKASRAFTSTR